MGCCFPNTFLCFLKLWSQNLAPSPKPRYLSSLWSAPWHAHSPRGVRIVPWQSPGLGLCLQGCGPHTGMDTAITPEGHFICLGKNFRLLRSLTSVLDLSVFLFHLKGKKKNLLPGYFRWTHQRGKKKKKKIDVGTSQLFLASSLPPGLRLYLGTLCLGGQPTLCFFTE